MLLKDKNHRNVTKSGRQFGCVLEELCMMAAFTELLGCNKPMNQVLLDKHFLRKHGKNAYYGQTNTK